MRYWKSRRGVECKGAGDHKFPAAWWLVTNGLIRLTTKELRAFDLRNRTREELQRLTLHEAAKLLEQRGWKFINEPPTKD